MNQQIRFSKEESEFFGLNIGRALLGQFDDLDLASELEKQDYDLIRLRVDDRNNQLIERLKAEFSNCFDAGSIVKYELEVKGLKHTDFLNVETSLRIYDGSNPESVHRIIEQASPANPIGYCSTPIIKKLIGREDELEYLKEYYSKLYVTEEKQLWLIQWNGDPVGFVANNISDRIMETPLALVLPAFRGKKLLHEIMISRNNYGVQHGLEKISNGARLDNSISQHVFTKFGMVQKGDDRILHLTPAKTNSRSV